MNIEEYVERMLKMCEKNNVAEFSVERNGVYPSFAVKFNPFPQNMQVTETEPEEKIDDLEPFGLEI